MILLNVVEAEDLKNTDVIGKSDPYCTVTFGAWQTRTRIIDDDLNPQWDFFTMVIEVVLINIHCKITIQCYVM